MALDRSPLETLRRGLPAIVLVGLLFAAVGLAVGLVRQEQFTASTDLVTGTRDGEPADVPGLIAAASTLASGYSEIGGSPVITRAAAARVRLSAEQVSSRLAFAPEGTDPILIATAKGPTPDEAIALSRAGAAALVSYVRRSTEAATSTDTLLVEYRRATNAVTRGEQAVEDAERSGSGASRDRRVQAARDDLSTSRLARRAAAIRYTNATQQSPDAAAVRVLSPAVSATSDRASAALQLVGIGAVAGLVAGVLLVLLRDARRRRRAARPA